jgi:hypothetical protein
MQFNVRLDNAEAPNWFTVGDVYVSLLKVLPAHEKDDPSTWSRFCAAICEETGAESTLVNEQTRLLGPSLIEQLRGWFGRD